MTFILNNKVEEVEFLNQENDKTLAHLFRFLSLSEICIKLLAEKNHHRKYNRRGVEILFSRCGSEQKSTTSLTTFSHFPSNVTFTPSAWSHIVMSSVILPGVLEPLQDHQVDWRQQNYHLCLLLKRIPSTYLEDFPLSVCTPMLS